MHQAAMTQGPEHLPAYKPGGRLETFDIEELVAEGKAGYAAHLSMVTHDRHHVLHQPSGLYGMSIQANEA